MRGVIMELRRLHCILGFLFEKMRYMEDNDRDLPMYWSMMHMFSTVQLAVLAGWKAGLNPEVCGISAALHDVATVMTGDSRKHAKRGGPFVHEIIDLYNDSLRQHLPRITEEERMLIHDSVINHTKKQVVTDNEYVEMMKHVDSLDHLLHGLYIKEKEIPHIEYMKNLFGLDN